MNLEQSPLYLQRPGITSPGLTSATMHATDHRASSGAISRHERGLRAKSSPKKLVTPSSGAAARTRAATRFAAAAYRFRSLAGFQYYRHDNGAQRIRSCMDR
jgi:hypothetical protein